MSIENKRVVVQGAQQEFESLVVTGSRPMRCVIFATGRGGDPHRHLPLLQALAAAGCFVVAPVMQMLATPFPTEDELQERLRELSDSVIRLAEPDLPVIGVGHSIGATLLLSLAGGQLWLGPEHRIEHDVVLPLKRLCLFAPATEIYQAPGALDGVTIPARIWVGENDPITTSTAVSAFATVLKKSAAVQLDVVPNAGHFSFMHELPPGIEDSLDDRDGFLQQLTTEVCRSVVG